MALKGLLSSVLLVIVLTVPVTSEVLHTLTSPNEEEEGYFGISVSGAGDVNGDGYDDVIIGARQEDPDNSPDDAGRAYVFDGLTGTLVHTLVSPNEEFDGYFGYSVSGAGDVNEDGYDDVAVGAYMEDPGSSPINAGRVYVFDGQTGNLLHTLASPNEEAAGYFGRSVSGVGDVDGDGPDDIVVGAYGEDPGSSPDFAGRAYLFHGQSGRLIRALSSPNEEPNGGFGYSVSGVRDTNGDGFSEVLIGTHLEESGSSPDFAGTAYIFSWMHLSSNLSGDDLDLHWSPWSPASEYWIYGADNLAYFNPGFAAGYDFRLVVIPTGTTTWSSPNGIGDPENNWTYLVIAVDETEAELARSNRVGEHDFDTDVP